MVRKKANNTQKDQTPRLEVNINWMKFIEKMKKLVQYTVVVNGLQIKNMFVPVRVNNDEYSRRMRWHKHWGQFLSCPIVKETSLAKERQTLTLLLSGSTRQTTARSGGEDSLSVYDVDGCRLGPGQRPSLGWEKISQLTSYTIRPKLGPWVCLTACAKSTNSKESNSYNTTIGIFNIVCRVTATISQ